MTYEEMLKYFNICEPLTTIEFLFYYSKYKSGDKEAKQKLIDHNIKLVISSISKFDKLYNLNDEIKKELFSIGLVELYKALLNFDLSKNVEFSTYALGCITGNMLNYFRRFKKYSNEISFSDLISCDIDIDVEETIIDERISIESDYENKDIYLILCGLVNNLQYPYNEVIKLLYGFYDNRVYTQEEVAKKLNLTISNVSRINNIAIRMLKKELLKIGINYNGSELRHK